MRLPKEMGADKPKAIDPISIRSILNEHHGRHFADRKRHYARDCNLTKCIAGVYESLRRSFRKSFEDPQGFLSGYISTVEAYCAGCVYSIEWRGKRVLRGCGQAICP